MCAYAQAITAFKKHLANDMLRSKMYLFVVGRADELSALVRVSDGQPVISDSDLDFCLEV